MDRQMDIYTVTEFYESEGLVNNFHKCLTLFRCLTTKPQDR